MKQNVYFLKTTSLCLLVAALLAVSAFPNKVRAADQSAVTLILVRHAEKKIVPPENKDPDLSPEGMARAEELARMFGNSGIAAIYATQYKRTQQTVQPLADKLGIPVSIVNSKNTANLIEQIRAQHSGQTVFIAGHNNTVPEIVAALGGPQSPPIPETQYDNVYVITVYRLGKARVVQMKYGASTP